MTHHSSSPDTYLAICIAVAVALIIGAVLCGRKNRRVGWFLVAVACLSLVLPALQYQTLAIDESGVTLTRGVGPLEQRTRIPFDGWVALSREDRYRSDGDPYTVWRAAYRDGTGIEFRTHLLRGETLELLRARGIRVEP